MTNDRDLLELLQDTPVAALMRRAADAPLAAWEQRMGLGESARRAYYGKNDPPRKSLLLSYFESLLEKANQEKDDAGFVAEEKFELPRPSLGLDIQAIPARIRSFVSELTEKTPGVLEGDTLTPHERVRRHIRFEKADRVAVAPLMGYHTARAGGVTVREFMTDGRKAAHAARRSWDAYARFDMLPFNFPFAYLFPFLPDSHTRFWNKWTLPDGDDLPKMDEQPLLRSFDDVLESGIIPLARTEAGHLLRELRAMLIQGAIYGAEMARLFPRMNRYYPYAATIVNHPADILSFWMGFEDFMMACATDPQRVREACDMLAPGIAEAGAFAARLLNSKQALYGVSRVSASYVSRKMFDDLFAPSFLSQVQQLHDQGFCITYHLDNDYTKFLDFFLELPRHSGFLHLDQTDMFEAKKVLHGHLCLMGNLHPGLMARGTRRQVMDACERLIKEVGADGGFILATACEVPVDTPEENLMALKHAVNQWGWY